MWLSKIYCSTICPSSWPPSHSILLSLSLSLPPLVGDKAQNDGEDGEFPPIPSARLFHGSSSHSSDRCCRPHICRSISGARICDTKTDAPPGKNLQNASTRIDRCVPVLMKSVIGASWTTAFDDMGSLEASGRSREGDASQGTSTWSVMGSDQGWSKRARGDS